MPRLALEHAEFSRRVNSARVIENTRAVSRGVLAPGGGARAEGDHALRRGCKCGSVVARLGDEQASGETRTLGRRRLLPPVPGPFLRLVLGQMSETFLGGQRVIPAKLHGSGFAFRYACLKDALEELLEHRD